MMDFWMIFILPILGYCDTPRWLSRLDEPEEITPCSSRRRYTIAEILISIFSGLLEFCLFGFSFYWSWVYFYGFFRSSRSCFGLLLYHLDICDLGYQSIRWGEWEWPVVHMYRIINRSTRCIDEVPIELSDIRSFLDRSVVQERCEECLRLGVSSTSWEPDRLVVTNYPCRTARVVSHIMGQIREDEWATREEWRSLSHDKNSEHRNENEENFYFQLGFVVVYRNLDITSPATIKQTQNIIRYGGIVFAFGFLAIWERSGAVSESMSIRLAPSESATDASLTSSRTELTRLPSDSLYLGSHPSSYPRRIGQPERVPTPMRVILAYSSPPVSDRIGACSVTSENSPSVIQMIERCGVLP